MGAKDLICEAIRCKKLLQFSYGNHLRVVAPHILGRDSSGHDILSAYLVRGYSESRKQPYWRFLFFYYLKIFIISPQNISEPPQSTNPKQSTHSKSPFPLSIY